MSLIRRLPPGSAIHREMAGEAWDWGPAEELLAALAQLVDFGNRMYLKTHAKPGTPMPDPLQIARPGEKVDGPIDTGPRPATVDEVKEFFGEDIEVT